MLLFFDTETTGLPSRDRKIRSDPMSWPRLVELGWILTRESGEVLEEHNFLIKPSGFEIPESVTKIHGISTAQADDSGIPLTDVLTIFCASAQHADLFVAHNLSYDIRIILTELIRLGNRELLPHREGICTMKSSSRFYGVPGKFGKGFKWPSLRGLYFKLFEQEPEKSHRALADTYTCAACFFELQKKGVKMSTEDITRIFFSPGLSQKKR